MARPSKKSTDINPTQVAHLHPDPLNRRLHPSRNLAMTVEALQTVGAARSIVIDEDNLILAGNGVTEAAQAIGITKVQVVETTGDTLVAVRRRGLTAEQKRALALYDNRAAELAEWNLAQLAADLKNGEDLGAYFMDGELGSLGLLGDPVDHPELGGLPEFEQPDQAGYHIIKIHFQDEAAMQEFGQRIGHTLTKQVKFLWVPPVKPLKRHLKEYA